MSSSPLGLVAASNSSSSGILMLPFYALIFVAMYFLLIRPQRRRTREAAELNRALDIGDQVLTASGLVGFITGFDKDDEAGDVAWIEIAENVEVRVLRTSVARRITPTPTPSPKDEASKDDAAE